MNKTDIKALFRAIRKHENKTVRALLSETPKLVNICASAPPKKDDGQSPLQVAFKTGNLRIAKLLIKLGADVNFMEESDINEWRTPVLHDALRAAVFTAIEFRFISGFTLVKKMLKLGADPNAADSHGNTPLMRAFLDARQVLSMDPGFPDHVKNKPLTQELRKICKLLVKSGASLEATNLGDCSMAGEPAIMNLLK